MAPSDNSRLLQRIERAGARDKVETKTLETLVALGVLTEKELDAFIEEAHAAEQDLISYACAVKPITAEQIAQVRAATHGLKAEPDPEPEPEGPAFDEKTERLVDLLIVSAAREKAAAIAVESGSGQGRVEFLIDGVREEVFDSVQQANVAKISACIKALAGLSVGEERSRFSRVLLELEAELELIVSSSSALVGAETLVLRFLKVTWPTAPEETTPAAPAATPEPEPAPAPAPAAVSLPPVFTSDEDEGDLVTVGAPSPAVVEAGLADSFEEELRRWVTARGSKDLQAMLERGFDVSDLYVEERAAVELPGFTAVNADDERFQTAPLTKPSRQAFALLTRTEELVRRTSGSGLYHTSLVQVSKNELPEEAGHELGAGEAVMIQGYLRSASTVLVQPVSVKEQLARFTRRWAMMQTAGVPTAEIFADLVGEEPSRRFKALLEQILMRLHERLPLADAFDLFPEEFPAHYRSMIRAGEQSGNLPDVVRQLAAE